MEPLKDSNRLGLYPVLDFKERSPPKLQTLNSSPVRVSVNNRISDLMSIETNYKTQIIQDAAPRSSPSKETAEPLSKPPGRVSPFKGKRALLSTTEIFSTTPKRINQQSKTQSVDRTTFSFVPTNESSKPEITFSSLKDMAPSNLRTINQTPSRMISGRRHQNLPNSEQPSRLNRPTVASALKSISEPTHSEFMDKLQSKSILKRRLSPNFENESSDSNDDATDMTTTLNTLKNTGSAKNVMKILNVEPDSQGQPRKKRAVTFEKNDEAIVLNEKIMDTLQLVLQNQTLILQKLKELEGKL